MCKIVVFGNGKMAELANFYFTHDSKYEVAAFTVNENYIKKKIFQGLPLVAFEEVEELYPPDKYKMFIAIGYSMINKVRAEKYFEAKSKGYELVSYFSSKTIHWNDVKIGDNCFVLENQVIQPSVKFGNNVIIWSGNHFGHNVTIGDHCWLSSHIICSGGVRIGPFTFIGVNTAIRDNIKIGSECIIGLGAIINKDTKDNEVYIAKSTDLYRLDSNSFEKMMNELK